MALLTFTGILSYNVNICSGNFLTTLSKETEGMQIRNQGNYTAGNRDSQKGIAE